MRVEGTSMEPGIRPGGWILVLRRWRRQRPLRRGQVVLVRAPDEPARERLKRVVGVPGESVSILGGSVHIDGRPLAERYAQSDPNESWGPIALSEGEYLVFGDNRKRSTDSRVWGAIRAVDVVGVAVLTSRRGLERHP
jgi:signal peptidase I